MDSLDIQKEILRFWESHHIHQKLNDLNKCNKKLTIYDGPPFPTGPPHHGHMMTSVVKDTVIRYLMSTGNYVPRKIGWDMFGNPTRWRSYMRATIVASLYILRPLHQTTQTTWSKHIDRLQLFGNGIGDKAGTGEAMKHRFNKAERAF